MWPGDSSMALQCPRCRRQYDVTLFQFQRSILCECGEEIDLERGHRIAIEPAGPPLHTDTGSAPDPAEPSDPPEQC